MNKRKTILRAYAGPIDMETVKREMDEAFEKFCRRNDRIQRKIFRKAFDDILRQAKSV